MLDGLFTFADAGQLDGAGGLEARVNHTGQYQMAVVDVFLQVLNPEQQQAVRERVDGALCDSRASENVHGMLLSMLTQAPELSDGGGIRCSLEHSRGQESTMLWWTLDAWRASGAPPSDELRSLREDAEDPRTRFRAALAIERPDADGEIALRQELMP